MITQINRCLQQAVHRAEVVHRATTGVHNIYFVITYVLFIILRLQKISSHLNQFLKTVFNIQDIRSDSFQVVIKCTLYGG